MPLGADAAGALTKDGDCGGPSTARLPARGPALVRLTPAQLDACRPEAGRRIHTTPRPSVVQDTRARSPSLRSPGQGPPSVQPGHSPRRGAPVCPGPSRGRLLAVAAGTESGSISVRPSRGHSSAQTHLHGSFVSHCSRAVLALGDDSAGPGTRSPLPAPHPRVPRPARYQHRRCPLLGAHARYGPPRALLGVVVWTLDTFCESASHELQLPATQRPDRRPSGHARLRCLFLLGPLSASPPSL